MTSGANHEEPLYLAGDGADLFGLYTHPTAPSFDIGVHLISGTGVHSTAGRARSRAHLARHLAAHGFGVLRTDHPGIGESSGEVATLDFTSPAVAEVREAVAYLGSRHRRVAVVANCFGCRNVIHAAGQLARLDAVVLIAPPLEDRDHGDAVLHHRPVREWVRRGIDPRRWPRFLGHARNGYARIVGQRARVELLRAIGRGPEVEPVGRGVFPTIGRWLEQGVPILLISSEEEDFHLDLLIALDGALGELVSRHPDLIEVVTATSRLSSSATVGIQREATDIITEWLQRRLDVRGTGTS